MTQQNQQQRVQPLAKGRACVVVEQYQAKDQNGNLLVNADQTPSLKNRYATIGKAIMWPPKEGEIHPNVSYTHELSPDYAGAYKVHFFWDEPAPQNQQQAPQQQAQTQYNQGQQTTQYGRK